MISVVGREVLGGLIVGLKRGQFFDQLFTAVELADFCQVNFGEAVLHFGCSLALPTSEVNNPS